MEKNKKDICETNTFLKEGLEKFQRKLSKKWKTFDWKILKRIISRESKRDS